MTPFPLRGGHANKHALGSLLLEMTHMLNIRRIKYMYACVCVCLIHVTKTLLSHAVMGEILLCRPRNQGAILVPTWITWYGRDWMVGVRIQGFHVSAVLWPLILCLTEEERGPATHPVRTHTFH